METYITLHYITYCGRAVTVYIIGSSGTQVHCRLVCEAMMVCEKECRSFHNIMQLCKPASRTSACAKRR
eukprot:5019875-Pleurochrysis_carterae.AAC.1